MCESTCSRRGPAAGTDAALKPRPPPRPRAPGAGLPCGGLFCPLGPACRGAGGLQSAEVLESGMPGFGRDLT